MKEAREVHLLTASIKTSVENPMAQTTSADAQVGYMSASLTQLVTPGSGECLYVMHQYQNAGDLNIGVLHKKLTGLCNVVGTLEQKMHHLSQNDTDQFIRSSSTNSPRDVFEVQLSTLKAELDGVRQLTAVGDFNTVAGYFKSLVDVTVWVRANLPSDSPKFEHFIDLDILLAGILQTGVSSKEVRNKEFHAERVNRSANQSMVDMSLHKTSP